MSKSGYVIGLVLIVVFGLVGFTSFVKSSSQYVDIADVPTMPAGRTLHVPGEVDQTRPAGHNLESGWFEFDLRDGQGHTLHVIYDGVKPGNFDQAERIVAVGTYQDGALHAHRLLVKCPSKYEGQYEVKARGGN